MPDHINYIAGWTALDKKKNGDTKLFDPTYTHKLVPRWSGHTNVLWNNHLIPGGIGEKKKTTPFIVVEKTNLKRLQLS